MNFNQNKDDFLSHELAGILGLIERANKWGANQFNWPLNELNINEFSAIFYAEAATDSQGFLDGAAVHSNGERGILPLPEHLEWWLDVEDVEKVNFTSEDNVELFMYYLVAIKNNKKTPYTKYFEGIGEVQSVDLLSAVVHGYLWHKNYEPLQFPLDLIVEQIVGNPVLGSAYDLITGLNYKNVHTLESRLGNMERGLALVADGFESAGYKLAQTEPEPDLTSPVQRDNETDSAVSAEAAPQPVAYYKEAGKEQLLNRIQMIERRLSDLEDRFAPVDINAIAVGPAFEVDLEV